MDISFQNYNLKQKIGEGGMGSVYLAEDNIGRTVAIKLLSPLLVKDKELISRFKMEAKVQASLVNSNIVTLFSYHEEIPRQHYYIVMEFAQGRTLKEIIKNSAPLPENTAIKIMDGILDGLGYAHSKGIIHRDIKPANIMVDENDSIKIMDFGVAKILGDKELTKTGVKMGTIFYMSPEQIRAEKNIDQRTDIFSLGATFYEMLTNKRIVSDNFESDFDIMRCIIEEPVIDPRQYNPNISENTVATILKMLQKNRDDRFATCYQASVALHSHVNNNIFIQQEIPSKNNDGILVEAGEFNIDGKNSYINPFYMDAYPVTVEEYRKFCSETKKRMPVTPDWGWVDNHPIVNISYYDALEYAKYFNKRLPFYIEWMYAALGGNRMSNTDFSGTNDSNLIVCGNRSNKPLAVGSSYKNLLGIYDLSGNVWEWTMDKYIKGGSYFSSSEKCKINFNARYNPNSFAPVIGFRCIREIN